MHTAISITTLTALVLCFLPSCSPLRHAVGSRQEEEKAQAGHHAAVRDTSFHLTCERLVQTVVEYYPMLSAGELTPLPDSAAIADVPPEVLPSRPRQMVKSVTRTEYRARSEASTARDSVERDTLATASTASEESSYEELEKTATQGSVKTSFVSVAIVAVCLLLIVAILKFKK